MPYFNNASNEDILARILTAWDTPGEMKFDGEESLSAGQDWNVYTAKAGEEGEVTLYAAQCGDGFTYFGVSDSVSGYTEVSKQKI